MKKILLSLTIAIAAITFSLTIISCEAMASLFHGPKPEETFTVTFDANGATGIPPETQTVNAGASVSLPDKGGLSSPGNVFVGWSESPVGAAAIYSVGSAVAIAKDTVFYAEWLDGSTPQYTVTFNPNGATGGAAPAPQAVYSGISIAIPGQGTLAYSGKVFGGWNTQSNGGGTNFAAGAAYKVTGNVTLYAKWNSEVQYTVTYHANGGSGSVPVKQTVDPGTEITIQGEGALTYTGRKFGGWNTQSNGSGTNYSAGEAYTVTGNATLYARWLEQYTVTFHANGASGTVPASYMVDPGTVITLPGQESMNYTGRIFKGWNTQATGSGTGYEEGGMFAVNENVSLYAQWEAVPIVPPGSTLAQQLAWIASQSPDGATYDITVNNDVYLAPTSVSTMGRNVIVNIRSASPANVRTIQLEGNGHLFSVDANVTLRLQDIELRGHSNNNRALVGVSPGGTLILNTGAKITMNNNTSTAQHGGGINVNGGFLEINNGVEVIGNKTPSNNEGGGIHVTNRGNVSIRGGLISENTGCCGGGIFITGNSTVTMAGGIISKNTCSGTLGGGGVSIENGSTFIKRATLGNNTSGIIYGGTGNEANISTGSGGGHAVRRNFTTLKQRNTTLGGFDEITTGNDVGWE